MDYYFAAVNARPLERMVGENIDFVPIQFYCKEVIHARFFHYLRQRARKAEHVGQPQYPHILSELLVKKPLAVKHLPNKGFRARNVGIGLHPHSALRFESFIFYRLLNPPIKVGIQFFYPLELLWLTRAEYIVVIFRNVKKLVTESSRRLALCFPNRP